MSWWQWTLVILLGGAVVLSLTQVKSLVRYIRIKQM